jgi:DNA-binding NarL/FixJ family response regulator
MKKIRLLIIEDNRLLRDGIASMLNEQPDLHVVASVGTVDTVSQKIQRLKPSIILLDMGLRSKNSIDLIRSIKLDAPAIRIIVMDLVPAQAEILEFVKAGVSGFTLKDATVDEFLKTIRSVAKGVKVLPSNLADSLFSQIVEHAVVHSGHDKLMEAVRMTKRERQVIGLIADGMTNKEIAQQLHLSTYTIKSHVHNILEKLALHTRVQIARYAHDTDAFKTAATSVTLLGQ